MFVGGGLAMFCWVLVACWWCVVCVLLGLGGLPSFCVVFWFIVGGLRSGCCVVMLFLICHVNVDAGWICRLVAWLVWYLC